jgi:hypothetical protein
MKTKLTTALFALLLTPIFAYAQGTLLNVYQTLDVNAPADDVWEAIKDFDGLSNWHPLFAESVLVSGENNVPGTVRRLTVKDGGPIFEEELLEWDAWDRKLRYRIIWEETLPVTDYQSTIQVLKTGRNKSTVVWRGQFGAKPGNQDQDVVAFINGAYRAGLDNLKQMVE